MRSTKIVGTLVARCSLFVPLVVKVFVGINSNALVFGVVFGFSEPVEAAGMKSELEMNFIL